MIDAPWYRDPIETTAFNLYAMEKEGLFLTPEERLEMVVEYLASVDNPNDEKVQSEAFTLAGINTNFLTDNGKHNERRIFGGRDSIWHFGTIRTDSRHD